MFLARAKKKCTKCRKEKNIDEFYKNRADCIECYLSYCKEYRKTNGRKIAVRKYAKTAKCKANQNRYNTRHPERRKAKEVVYGEVMAGRLAPAKKLKCHYCGNQAQEYHHHFGYNPENWLDILPICIKCHKYIHLIKSSA